MTRKLPLCLFVLFLFILLPVRLSAQKFLWDVDFHFIFDNKEYDSMENTPSMTDFGAFILPKVGLGFGEGHGIYLGGNFGRRFGKCSSPKYSAEMLLYYQYQGKHLFINAGAFPAKSFREGYFPVITSLSFQFDNVAEGTIVRYKNKGWTIEGLADWTGMYDRNTRESFMIQSYGEYEHPKFPYLSIAYIYVMNHFANSETVRGVVDNIWLYPYLGFNLAPLTPLEKLGGKAGWLNTFQNDRKAGKGYLTPGGMQFQLEAEYWGFGINDILYVGPNLMPYYHTLDNLGHPYGADLYFAERFYGTDHGLYNRLEAYWKYHFRDMLNVKISTIHHFDGQDWGWQQMITLSVNLNQSQFPWKKNSHRSKMK